MTVTESEVKNVELQSSDNFGGKDFFLQKLYKRWCIENNFEVNLKAIFSLNVLKSDWSILLPSINKAQHFLCRDLWLAAPCFGAKQNKTR